MKYTEQKGNPLNQPDCKHVVLPGIGWIAVNVESNQCSIAGSEFFI